MNLKSLSLQAIDKLIRFWEDKNLPTTAVTVTESREESAAVIEAVFAPVIADLERDMRQVSELCDAEIAKRQELDCQIFDLERRLGLARDGLIAGIKAIERLEGEQAMPDDSYLPLLKTAQAALAQLGAPSPPLHDDPIGQRLAELALGAPAPPAVCPTCKGEGRGDVAGRIEKQ